MLPSKERDDRDGSRHSRETSSDSIRQEDPKRRRLSDSLDRSSYSESERDRTDYSYRSRSPVEDNQTLPTEILTDEERSMEANYTEVMEWIQDYSPEFNMAEDKKPTRPKSFTESMLDSEQPSTSKALPWSPGCNAVMEEINSIVKGDPSSRRSTAPIKKPKLIPSYEFPNKFYRILDNPRIEPDVVNPEMEDLVPTNLRHDVRRPKVKMSSDVHFVLI